MSYIVFLEIVLNMCFFKFVFYIMSLFYLYFISFMLLFYHYAIFLRHIGARRGLGRFFMESATCESKAACQFLKMLIFSLWDLARKMRLVKSFRFLGSNREKGHWASSCGHFIARKEFWSQCHMLRFLRS